MTLLDHDIPPAIASRPSTPRSGSAILERAWRVADVAARNAIEVDRDGAFPHAALEAAKTEGLLALLVPRDFGGEGAPLSAIADVCYTLGQACGSTALIVAMHQAALACIIDHRTPGAWHDRFLRRVVADNLLLASSTTEGQGGGNVRSSEAAVIRDGECFSFSRAATVVSYGARADAIVSLARRDPASTAADQVCIVLLKENYRLSSKGGWNTLGMRGTCSEGFSLDAQARCEQILPASYDKIHAQTMVPVSHLVWASVWAGIAAAAVSRAQMFVRTAARKSGGQLPPGAIHATLASASLGTLLCTIQAALTRVGPSDGETRAFIAPDAQARWNLFKVEASERAVATVCSAMRAAGLAGYRNDGEFALGRHLRDVLSAPIMINNERILTNVGAAALMGGVPTSLSL